MAHQAKHRIHVEIPARAIERRPKLCILLGVVASEWSALESDLTFLYGSLLRKTMPHDREAGPPVHPVGLQIFETLVTHEPRLRLIEKLAKLLIKDKGLLREIDETVIPELKQVSKKRNNRIHAYWGFNDEEYPEALIKILGPGNFEVYEESDFNKAIESILSTADTVHNFEKRVINYLRTTNFPSEDL